jgi:hypothetical protein
MASYVRPPVLLFFLSKNHVLVAFYDGVLYVGTFGFCLSIARFLSLLLCVFYCLRFALDQHAVHERIRMEAYQKEIRFFSSTPCIGYKKVKQRVRSSDCERFNVMTL